MTDSKIKTELINMIMRQTDYDREKVCEKLIEHNDDYMKIIREYIGSSKVVIEMQPIKSVNQQIYKEIRTLMDDAAINYLNNKK